MKQKKRKLLPWIIPSFCFFSLLLIGLLIWKNLHLQLTTNNNINNNIDNCKSDECCQNDGYCHYGKCICKDGYYGEFCENNCLNDTICSEECEFDCYGGHCFCPPNFMGDNCEYKNIDLSYCNDDDDCGEGYCIKNDLENGECFCPLTNLLCFHLI